MQDMIGKMAKTMYPLMIVMGLMIVIIAFVIGYLNPQTMASYFSTPKVERETTMMAQRAAIESVGVWLPTFKFLGIGFILGGIVMALRVIIDRLKTAGKKVLSNLPPGKRPQMPQPPFYGPLMPLVMMVGEMIFIGALVAGLWAAGIARTVFANPLPEIDAAGPGSQLLNGLQTLHAVEGWLIPLKFFGIATEFLAIAMGLGTIIFILSSQTEMLKSTLGSANN